MRKEGKRKALAGLVCGSMLTVALVGGTMAYLADTAGAVNVMTLGNVDIVQNEQQRVESDGQFTNVLEPFDQGKALMPAVYPVDREADTVEIGENKVGLTDDVANYVDKIVSVTNAGKSDAYVRTLVAVPTGGADWEPTAVSANDCWLHWNYPYTEEWAAEWTLNGDYTLVEIDGEGYYVWEFVHVTAVEAGKTTYPVIKGFYMDERVGNDDSGYFMGDKRIDDVELGGTANVVVISQAVQTEGFADAQTALDTAFGDVTAEKAAEWFGGMKAYVVSTAEELKEGLKVGGNVIILDDITATATESNAYGKTGFIQKGGVFDGCGNTLSVSNADSTWDSAITITGGTIKNLTINSGFRGVFVMAGTNPVVLDNVVVDGPVYTISCDEASDQGLSAMNSTFNGWTSYAATIGAVKFDGCSFGEGSGYAYCRPYAPTEFVDCDFEAGFEMDPRAAVTFDNCTIDGVVLTSDNLATLVTSNIANATVK